MTGRQNTGTVTWDAQAGEHVQWHGRSRDYQAGKVPAAPQQDQPAGKEDRR